MIKGTPLPADSVTTAAIQDEAVTSDKIDFSTIGRTIVTIDCSTTGTKTVSVGFKPNKVTVIGGRNNNAYDTLNQSYQGFALRSGEQFSSGTVTNTNGTARSVYSSDTRFVVIPASGGSSLTISASITGWTETGFTYNVTSAANYIIKALVEQ